MFQARFASGRDRLSGLPDMFEEELLLGETEHEIVVQTRRGTPIPNSISPEPGERQRRRYELIRKRFGQTWTNRKAACGGYNCFGMVFAARRTAIWESCCVETILKEDGYRLLPSEKVAPGDLVLYRDRVGKEPYHVALVLRREELGAWFALSKWNDTSGEDIHNIQHHCWVDFDVEIEFWTDRSTEP